MRNDKGGEGSWKLLGGRGGGVVIFGGWIEFRIWNCWDVRFCDWCGFGGMGRL